MSLVLIHSFREGPTYSGAMWSNVDIAVRWPVASHESLYGKSVVCTDVGNLTDSYFSRV
jgi:hypothetical protein